MKIGKNILRLTWEHMLEVFQAEYLVINVSKEGYVSGTKTNGNISDSFTGGIGDGGALQSTTSAQTGFTLYGNLSSMSGTWKQGNWSGTWTVMKK